MRILVFPGAHNLPLWVMREEKTFSLDLIAVRSRDEQMARMTMGQGDVVMTAPDNLWLADAPNLSPFMRATVGPLWLVQGPDWDSRRRFGADNPHSGYALLAYRWMELQKEPPGSYDVLALGGTPARFQALVRGEVDRAVLAEPYTAWAISRGFLGIARVDEGFPTLVAACPRERSADAEMEDFCAAYHAAIDRMVAKGKNYVDFLLRLKGSGWGNERGSVAASFWDEYRMQTHRNEPLNLEPWRELVWRYRGKIH